jgi:ParB/RepB/Spo0J family partition protein
MAEGELVHNVWLVPVDKIVWRGALRKFSDEEIQELAASFRVYGQLQPIMVRPLKDGLFEGVFGYQRYLAARRAGLTSILCIVKPCTDDEVYEARLVENIHRKELAAMEKAEWVKKLVELRMKSGFKEESVYEAVANSIEAYTGEKPASETVRKLVYLASKIKKKAKDLFLGERRIGLKHLEQLARTEDEHVQASLGEKAAMEGWAVQKLKTEVDKALGVEKPKETWVCDCCEQEQSPEEGKAIIKLCPKCLGDFEAWRHESGRVAEPTGK